MTYAHDAHCNTIHEAGPEPCPPTREDTTETHPLTVLTVGPGDLLVIVLPADTDIETMERTADEWVQICPDLDDRLLFVSGVEQLALIKAEREAP